VAEFLCPVSRVVEFRSMESELLCSAEFAMAAAVAVLIVLLG
jgi:hypothetical protein